jgi:hypothetical protein
MHKIILLCGHNRGRKQKALREGEKKNKVQKRETNN